MPGYSTDGLLSGCDSGHDGEEQLRRDPCWGRAGQGGRVNKSLTVPGSKKGSGLGHECIIVLVGGKNG